VVCLLKICCEMIAALAYPGCDLFNAEKGRFEQLSGLLHSEFSQIPGDRLSGFLFEEMSQVRWREADGRCHFIDRQFSMETGIHQSDNGAHSLVYAWVVCWKFSKEARALPNSAESGWPLDGFIGVHFLGRLAWPLPLRLRTRIGSVSPEDCFCSVIASGSACFQSASKAMLRLVASSGCLI
jgi:hypothetical protein